MRWWRAVLLLAFCESASGLSSPVLVRRLGLLPSAASVARHADVDVSCHTLQSCAARQRVDVIEMREQRHMRLWNAVWYRLRRMMLCALILARLFGPAIPSAYAASPEAASHVSISRQLPSKQQLHPQQEIWNEHHWSCRMPWRGQRAQQQKLGEHSAPRAGTRACDLAPSLHCHGLRIEREQ